MNLIEIFRKQIADQKELAAAVRRSDDIKARAKRVKKLADKEREK